MDNCTMNCILTAKNVSERCAFVQSSCVQDDFQTIEQYFCILHESFFSLILLSAGILVFVYMSLDVLASKYLTPCVNELVRVFRTEWYIEKSHQAGISPSVAGMTLLAFANGAPDVITAITASNSSAVGTTLIPFGSLYGAGLFLTSYVFGVVISVSPGAVLEVQKTQSVLPLGVYLLGSLYLILVSLLYRRMNVYLAAVPIVLYIAFVILALIRNKPPEIRMEEEKAQSERYIIGGCSGEETMEKKKPLDVMYSYCFPPMVRKEWSCGKALAGLCVSPFVLMMNMEDPFEREIYGIPYAVVVSVPSMILIVHSLILTVRKQGPGGFFILYTIYGFIVVVAAISTVCSLLISLIELVQLLTSVNSVFLGLTVLAWANCIGDYFSITTFARLNNSSIAVAATFSGQLFNLLIGLGSGLFTAAWKGEYSFNLFGSAESDTYTMLSNSILWLVVGACLGYIVGLILLLIKRKGVVGLTQAKVMRFYYIGFLVISFVLALSTDFFRSFECK